MAKSLFSKTNRRYTYYVEKKTKTIRRVQEIPVFYRMKWGIPSRAPGCVRKSECFPYAPKDVTKFDVSDGK